MYLRLLALAALTLPLRVSAAEPIGQLNIPAFTGLQSKASEVVDITLGSFPLALASKFMNTDNPENAEIKKIVAGIKSIAVRSYEFDSDFVYSKDDVEAVRKQLSAPGWTQLAQVHKRNKAQDVEVYIALTDDQAKGFAIVASEPRKFTILNIVGSIDLAQIAKLQHHVDLHVDLDDALDVDASDIAP